MPKDPYLSAALPTKQDILAVDLSEGMLAELRRRWAPNSTCLGNDIGVRSSKPVLRDRDCETPFIRSLKLCRRTADGEQAAKPLQVVAMTGAPYNQLYCTVLHCTCTVR